MSIHATLAHIQKNMRVPKDKKNDFGGYSYRNAESILAEAKRHQGEAVIMLSDQVVEIAGRVYIKASATIAQDGDALTVTAYAREPQTAKGKDESQITGSASSYARKYALQGLLAIDDGTADPDAEHAGDGARRAILTAKHDMDQADDVDQLRAIAGKYKPEASAQGWADALLKMFLARQEQVIAGEAGDAEQSPGVDQGGTSPASTSDQEVA